MNITIRHRFELYDFMIDDDLDPILSCDEETMIKIVAEIINQEKQRKESVIKEE